MTDQDKKEITKMIAVALEQFKAKELAYKKRIPHDRPSDPNTLGSFNWQLPVSGSRASNVALTNLLNQLAITGLIINSTT